ncbi:MAG: type I DNA topoisomerase [Candidatus Levybacteria bacterium]|nr:type I DNA topoisomerase [Candidatus Levybacteria bacterium]
MAVFWEMIDFAPQYDVVADKEKIIKDLTQASKAAAMIILATDPDREGEAIASHIKDVLTQSQKSKVKSQKFKRIVFHEITKGAIEEALQKPRDIDSHLVNAQTARRVLDRLVGYKLSPILWQKVRRGLSAGRVQSVALRLIVEREREIEKFAKEPYFTIHALLRKTQNSVVEFDLVEINGKKIEEQITLSLYDGEYKTTKTTITTLKHAEEIVSEMKQVSYVVSDVSQKEMRRSPLPPYTTSTLQQDSARRFGITGKRTMGLAQKLYEEGFITYHRTDSVIISQSAISAFRTYIKDTYGDKYLPEKQRVYTTKQKSAQEAHEGIRPTHIKRTTYDVRKELKDDYAQLYDLIWRRSLASQMEDAATESTTVLADSITKGEKKYRLKANGSVLKFDGFLKVNPQALQDKKLPEYTAGENLSAESVRSEAHETQAPPRYNDASLIRTLEEKSIGRPSTYATIVSTLTDRGYVERVERRFEPTSVGIAVNDFLVTHFSTIDDIPFTAQMEDDLDEVANGNKEWVKMMKDFYSPFEKQLEEVKGAARVKIAVEETDEMCPECKQGNLVIRTGRFGKFLSCGRFPECKFTKALVEETNLTCPKDSGKIIIKKTRKGRKFFGCSNYPNCDFAAWKLEDIKQSSNLKSQSANPQLKS